MRFRSLRSGSSGNCLLLRGEKSSVLIDCGLKTKTETEAVLLKEVGSPWELSGAVFSHCHGDHVGQYPVRLLLEMGVRLHAHERCLHQIEDRLGMKPPFQTFKDEPFQVGEFVFEAINLEHYPGVITYGFTIKRGRLKAAILTDFCAWGARLVGMAKNSHFIYIEANHDADLLAKYYNPGSEYHMRNEGAGELLCDLREASDFSPKAVMLGHLSKDRNRQRLAEKAVKDAFAKRKLKLDFELHVAPRDFASPTVSV
ncbi:MAG: MBL fold metallo-hydrolase [Elusimicrobiota bacterium]